MDLRFADPELAKLDELESEVLACSVWEDVRPCGGVAGLCDWRLAGRLSALQREGFLAGTRGEILLVPGRPHIGFDKILFFGAGRRDAFDETVFLEVMNAMLRAMEGLCTRAAVVELPGRQNDLIKAERAADMLLEAAAHERIHSCHDTWTLVEDAEARRRITQHMIEDRRRIRRMQ